MPFSPRVMLSLDRPLSQCSSAIQSVGGALREALVLPARQGLPVPDQHPCSNGAQRREEGRSAERHPVAGQAWMLVEDRATHPIDWQWCRERITCGRACRPPYCCAVLLSRFTGRSGSDSIRGISSRTRATRCRYRPVHNQDTCLDVAPETEE